MSATQSKPIWFIFPGLEAYDPSPPISILTFPPFVKLCNSLNEKTGFNLLETIVSEGSSPSLATVFATITTLQTSLVHLLASLGITPDGFIGYGIGEFAASYMDGCYDAETAIFLSHTIGRKIDDSGYRRGAMALVHQNESQFFSFFSNSGVAVSAHNTDNCITIAGSQKNVEQVLEKLKMDKIKCSPIASYSTALHCSQMDYLKDTAMESLYRLIDSPKPRSNRWVSTTVAETEDCLRLSCPRYFLRNLTSPVLFREACSELPSNVIVIEVNYRSILESFVKSNHQSPESIIYLTIPCLDNMDTIKSTSIGYQLFNSNIINNNNNNNNSISMGLSTDKLVDYLPKESRNSGVYEFKLQVLDNQMQAMNPSHWLSDEDELTSEAGSEVAGTISDYSQEIDLPPDESVDTKNDDIYESLLKSPETQELVDPIAELEAFLKSIHGEDDEDESKQDKPSIGNLQSTETFAEKMLNEEPVPKDESNSRKVKRERNKSPRPMRVLRPRKSKIYWNESSLFYLKTQENMYSYYSDKQKKRL